MIPKMPNIKAAGNANIISNPPRIAKGLPQPGLHRSDKISVAPAIISRAADIFPNRICFPFSNCLASQQACVTHTPGHSDAVEIIEQGDGEFSGGVEQILEFDALQAAFLLDMLCQ